MSDITIDEPKKELANKNYIFYFFKKIPGCFASKNMILSAKQAAHVTDGHLEKQMNKKELITKLQAIVNDEISLFLGGTISLAACIIG